MLSRLEFDICGAAHSGDEASDMAKARPPDVAVAGVVSAKPVTPWQVAGAIRMAAGSGYATADRGDPHR
jgi:hypothetical protein